MLASIGPVFCFECPLSAKTDACSKQQTSTWQFQARLGAIAVSPILATASIHAYHTPHPVLPRLLNPVFTRI